MVLIRITDAMTRRPWTLQDQITVEVAAACGVSCAEIGRALGRHSALVKTHIVFAAAQEHRERGRSYYQLNADKICEKRRLYREFNPEKVRESEIRWRKANPDKVLKNNQKWAKANPKKMRECCRRRDAKRRSARFRALQPVTRQEIDARFALWGNRCAFCGVDAKHSRNAGHDRLTVEHVLALTKNGLDEADNIMPACHSCNSSKHTSPVETWYRKQPFFTEARWRKICRHCPGAVIGQLPLAIPPADTEAA